MERFFAVNDIEARFMKIIQWLMVSFLWTASTDQIFFLDIPVPTLFPFPQQTHCLRPPAGVLALVLFRAWAPGKVRKEAAKTKQVIDGWEVMVVLAAQRFLSVIGIMMVIIVSD